MTTAASWVELGKRAADGLEVRLLWNRSSNRVKVVVNDVRLCTISISRSLGRTR